MTRISILMALAAVLSSAGVSEGNDRLGAAEIEAPDESSRCVVCGMLVAPHADWLARVTLEDGATLYFDGAKDLFRFLLEPEKYGHSRLEPEQSDIYVTSYYDRKPIRARDAYFVAGSDVLGPMGAELVPHPDREAAEEFMADHNGSEVLAFDEVTQSLVASLR